MVPKAVYADLSRCIACHACEVACEREYGISRVRVDTVVDEVGMGAGGPVSCRQCETAFCAAACPEKALVRKEVLKFDPELCTGCGLCALACPFGAIELENGFVQRCDLCPGKEVPVCVATCPTGALFYTNSVALGGNIRKRRGKEMLKALFLSSGAGKEEIR